MIFDFRAALLLLCLASPSLAAPGTWKQVLKAAPWSARSDFQLVNLEDTLYLFGGHANKNYHNDVWSSTDGGSSWSQLPNAPWSNRSYHSSKLSEGIVYMIGGHDGKTWYNDVWSFDGETWTQVNANAPWEGRAAAALQFKGDKMFVMGGSHGLLPPIGKGKCFNDVWMSEDKGVTWQQVSESAPWPAREGMQKLTALYDEDGEERIVLTSGEAGYFGPYYNDVWSTTDGANWTQVSSKTAFSARSGNLLLNLEGSLYTFGGYGFPFMKHDGYCLPAGSKDWIKLPDAPWKGRFDYDWEPFNGGILLAGGEASLFGIGGPYFNDIWFLDSPTCEEAVVSAD